MPTSSGCAVFMGDGTKVIVFYIDPAIGASINAVLAGVNPPRPLTHDLFTDVLSAFGAEVLHVTITRVEGEVFFARLYVKAENELMERKLVELDSRPSDAVALAVRAEAPIFFVREAWDQLEDCSETLEDLRREHGEVGGFGLND